jgi:hypothetical protein
VSWYVSRYMRLEPDLYFCVEGIDPWNKHALTAGPLGEHARWWLKLQQKHQRWPWWQTFPPQISGVRMIHVTWVDRLLGRLFVAWAIWKLAKPW